MNRFCLKRVTRAGALVRRRPARDAEPLGPGGRAGQGQWACGAVEGRARGRRCVGAGAGGKGCDSTPGTVLIFCMSEGARGTKAGDGRHTQCAGGGIGRRAGFRFQCPKGRGGSTPPSRTAESPSGPRPEGLSRCPGCPRRASPPRAMSRDGWCRSSRVARTPGGAVKCDDALTRAAGGRRAATGERAFAAPEDPEGLPGAGIRRRRAPRPSWPGRRPRRGPCSGTPRRAGPGRTSPGCAGPW